jgi:hypothetical protein
VAGFCEHGETLYVQYIKKKMEGFSFGMPVTGLNRPNSGKEDDDDLKKSDFLNI